MSKKERAARELAEMEACHKRSIREKREVVRMLAKSHRDWSHRRLMRVARVSWDLVVKILRELKDPRGNPNGDK